MIGQDPSWDSSSQILNHSIHYINLKSLDQNEKWIFEIISQIESKLAFNL